MFTNTSRGFIFFIPAIIISLAALSVGTVATSQGALPGDMLYGIKTASEHARLLIAFTDVDKVKTYVSLAQEKVREIEKLQMTDENIDKIDRVKKELQDNTSKASLILALEKNSKKDFDGQRHALQVIIDNGYATATAANALSKEYPTNTNMNSERGNATSTEAKKRN